MSQATLASIPESYSVQEAAAQIVVLINSCPRSPRQDEIEAIIGRVGFSAASASAAAKAAEWRRALAGLRQGFKLHEEEYDRWKAAGRQPSDEDLNRVADIDVLGDRVESASFAAWKAGAACWADIALFAEIARYWTWDPEDSGLEREFQAALQPHDTGLDTQALAQLVNAVLTVGKEVRS